MRQNKLKTEHRSLNHTTYIHTRIDPNFFSRDEYKHAIISGGATRVVGKKKLRRVRDTGRKLCSLCTSTGVDLYLSIVPQINPCGST